MKADIGMIGLGVMGSNLARNMVSKGFSVSCYDWDESLRSKFSAAYPNGFVHADTLKHFVASIERPRKIMMMIKAGSPVDSVLGELVPLLEPGDVLIDGGNSQWEDTVRRIAFCEEQGLLFVGCGVSGGEEGALNGPAMMPGGSDGAWPLIQPLFEAIAARTPEGVACVDWIGPGGSGHFVKMVHNGIEYGDMQMICETYQVMRDGLEMSNIAMSEVFGRWNKGKLNSYLIEITRDILAYEDADGVCPVDMVTLKSVHEEILRLSRLVDTLREIEFIESGKLQLELESIDPADLARRAAALFVKAAREKDIRLSVEARAAGLPGVRGDYLRLGQVLHNLLANALRYTPPGGRIRITAGTGMEETVVTLTVEDSGPGIPGGEREKVFERFYRLDRARSSEEGGRGLGLSIAWEIVKAHGGTLTAGVSGWGGAAFRVELPAEVKSGS